MKTKSIDLLAKYADTEATLWIADHGKTQWAESRHFACLRDAVTAIDGINPARQFVVELLIHEPGYDRSITGDEIVELRRALKSA